MQQSLCVQDMLYRKNLLEAMGLEVALPLILEVDNKGLVDIVNSFSVGGRKRHIDIKQFFLRELKESKQLIFMWIPGSTNNVNPICYKNLDGPLFKEYAEMLPGDGALDMHKRSEP